MSIASLPGSAVQPFDGRIAVDSLASDRTWAATARNEAIDVVRLFAAVAVIFVHSAQSPVFADWTNLFRFAVPFFLFASLYYQSSSLERNQDRSLARFIAGRFTRLYLPFLAWSLIYLVARDIKRIKLLHIGLVPLQPQLLWKGTEYHLWFLPFLLAGSIILAVIQRTLLRGDRRLRWLAIAAAVTAGFTFAFARIPTSWDPVFDSSTYAYVQWWNSATTLCWAMAFAWLMTLSPYFVNVSKTIGLAGIALAVGYSLRQVAHGLQLIPRALTGLGCMLAALAPWSGPAVTAMARLGRYGYGIYLCHVLLVECAHAIVIPFRLVPSPLLDLATFCISLAGSVALVLALGRSRRLAWLNG